MTLKEKHDSALFEKDLADLGITLSKDQIEQFLR